MSALLAALKTHFGYDSFRPLQEEIITDSLAGRDVFALLPTGAGKSLCYQLPALVRDGLTVVVSPLIALMKDQVDSLTANGVAATFLNSTLGEKESRSRLAGLYNGEYRLLYAAPERLMIDSFLSRLREWNVALVAIDEAHCISEWGHDFRPEYRQLSRLRDELPGVPLMALTATATGRVREDIVRQLRLEDASNFVASFNRPNLHYRVTPKRDAYPQLVEFIRQRRRESGIVYCFSRKNAETVAEKLRADGVSARPYHAGLTDTQRSENQEAFLRDDAHVICATIAFGMGINKPNVRFVVHYDLPKNLEGYYQETGRAGRDGLPSDCLLFFTSGDVMKYQRFIDEMTSDDERRIARAQLRQMVHFAECPGCRRADLLAYFGETYPDPNCGACDNCLAPRDTYDGTVPAQKLISTILRAKQSSRDGDMTFGLNHHIDVLLGHTTERTDRWGHARLSTFGIGADLPHGEWAAIARELIRLGYLVQSTDKFATIDVTDAGLDALRARAPITLTRALATPAVARRPRRKSVAVATESASDEPPDDTLFEKLRELRRTFADERSVPAYVIFSDAALRHMAVLKPTTAAQFLEVNGVGEKKRADFGEAFLALIREHQAQAS
ncbi:MAG: DNA helicase RecQ [Chthoniobacteraceae bacterium]